MDIKKRAEQIRNANKFDWDDPVIQHYAKAVESGDTIDFALNLDTIDVLEEIILRCKKY